jgi:hypothetical protein
LFDIGRHFVKRIVAEGGDGWHDFGGPTSPISRGKGPQSGREGGPDAARRERGPAVIVK